jgi:hypothetical protein
MCDIGITGFLDFCPSSSRAILKNTKEYNILETEYTYFFYLRSGGGNTYTTGSVTKR